MTICLDIETTGLLPSPNPSQISKGNTEDYIVAIGCLDDTSLNIFSAPFDLYKEPDGLKKSEEFCLNAFADYYYDLLDYQSTRLLTYNGISFDVPFITSKLLQLPRHTDSRIIGDLLDTSHHIDLMRYSQYVTGRRLTKDDACRKLGNLYIPRKSEGLWNARIYKNPTLLTDNDHIEMLSHNAIDLTATQRLFNVVRNFPDYGEWLKSGQQGASYNVV